MNALILLLASFASSPVELSAYDRCEKIEVHRYYSDSGELCWVQIIFWDMDEFGVDVVRDFKLYQDCDFSHPYKHAGKWRVAYEDGGEIKVVDGDSVQYSHLQFDPEQANRNYVPQTERRGLRSVLLLRELREQLNGANARSGL